MGKNTTLYVKNLNEKIPITYLKETLLSMFQPYGRILDIKMKKNFRMKGQAFIMFGDVNSATKAMEMLDQTLVYNKPMMINYARTKTDAGLTEEEKQQRKAQSVEKDAEFKKWVNYIKDLRNVETLAKLQDEQEKLITDIA